MPNIFDYKDALMYLQAYWLERKKANPRYSLRAWATKLGFKGHSNLVEILQGKRALRSEHVPQILAAIKLSSVESEYFTALVGLAQTQIADEKKFYQDRINTLRAKQEQWLTLSIEDMEKMWPWYFIAILSLITLKDFKNDLQWIKKKLGDKLTLQEISHAIQVLQQIGLIVNKDNHLSLGYTRIKSQKSTDPRAKRVSRARTKQMIEKGIEYLELPPEQQVARSFQTLTMAIQTSRITAAQAKIIEFIKCFQAEFSADAKADGDEVYQLNLEFFPLTRG